MPPVEHRWLDQSPWVSRPIKETVAHFTCANYWLGCNTSYYIKNMVVSVIMWSVVVVHFRVLVAPLCLMAGGVDTDPSPFLGLQCLEQCVLHRRQSVNIYWIGLNNTLIFGQSSHHNASNIGYTIPSWRVSVFLPCPPWLAQGWIWNPRQSMELKS